MKINNILAFVFASILSITFPYNLEAQNTSDVAKSTIDDHDDIEEENKSTESEHKLTIDKVDPSRFNTVATIQILNKITAKTSLLEVKVGNTINFGKLNITIHKCWQSSLDQRPESKILLEVYDGGEVKASEESKMTRIFYGWMFSSSPSVSALEHPIYDITAVSCKNK